MANNTIYNSTYATQTPATDVTGSYHLSANPQLYEIQRTNNFEFIVTGLDKMLKAGVEAAAENANSRTPQNSSEILRLSVSSAPVPHFKQTPLSIRRGNSVMKFAGVPEFNGGQITFNDYIGADTKAILMAWQNLSYNVRTQNVGLMSDYKKTATLIEYSPDYKKVRSWTLVGCWISEISEGEYNQEDGGKHDIKATIEYDYAYPDVE